MTESPGDFKYDAAFSFLSEDETTATNLAEQLEDSLRVFIYTERQKDLAGEEGVEAFSSVFREQTRLCVVLYRDGWGRTKWTAVEEEAIKGRGFDDGGWDSVLFVMLDRSQPPKWLPSNRIWANLEKLGIAGAAGVIEARVEDVGGSLRRESPAEMVARLEAVARRRAEGERLLQSRDGAKLIEKAVDDVFASLEAEVENIKRGTPTLRIGIVRKDSYLWLVRTPRASATFLWSPGSLSLRPLLVREFDCGYSFDRWGDEPRVRTEAKFKLTFDEAGVLVWREQGTGELVLTSNALAARFLKRVIKRYYERGPEADQED